ncbi:hypothetical protein D9M71_550000 [compost metagenome]
MPGFASFGLDHNPLAVLSQDAQATAGHAQHQRLDIGGQQQVATATHHQHRHTLLTRLGQRLTHLIVVVGFGEVPSPHIDAKGVIRLERYLLLPLHAHRRPLSSMTKRLQAASIRSRTSSKSCSAP